MPRFNFTNITLATTADITDVMNNFNEIEENGAIIDDLPKTESITLLASNWVTTIESGTTYYVYTINNLIIQSEPYDVEVVFNDLTVINDPIYPKPNSQAAGSIKLVTTVKPVIDLVARLIVTKGVQQ